MRVIGSNKPVTLAATCRTFGDVMLAKAFRDDCRQRGISVQRGLLNLVSNYLASKYRA